MVFRSKIDLWLLVVFAAATVLSLIQALVALREGSNWIPQIVIFGLLGGSITWLVVSTKYTVSLDTLVIQSGPFKWRIAKNEITKIASSKSILSSPALSLDRLKIDYAGGRNSVLISPRDKNGFLNALAVTSSAA